MSIARRLPRVTLATLAAVTAGVTLSACGGGGGAAQPSNASFNVADVGFAQQMLPHHLQAVKMSTLAATRAKDPKVMKLAAAILTAQGPEITTMQDLLEKWGQPLMAGMPGMDYSQMTPEQVAELTPGSIPGMATDDALVKLNATKGAAFDRLYLALMLEHHRGALQMAKTQRADGKATEAIALAEDIETGQSAEITRMNKLQNPS